MRKTDTELLQQALDEMADLVVRMQYILIDLAESGEAAAQLELPLDNVTYLRTYYTKTEESPNDYA